MKRLILLLALVGCSSSVPQPDAAVDAQVIEDAARPDVGSYVPSDLSLPSHPSSEFGLPIDLGSMWPQCTNGQGEPAVVGPVFICYGQNGKPQLSREGRVCFVCNNLKTPCSSVFSDWDVVCLSTCAICNLV